MNGIKGIGRTIKTVPRREFNYGRTKPWLERTETPQEYLRTELLLKAICERALSLSSAAWELEMALRDVRNAETDGEYQLAVATLRTVRAANDVLGIDATFNTANMPGDATSNVETIGQGAARVVDAWYDH